MLTNNCRHTSEGSLPVAGPLEALGVDLLQHPLPTIPERGGIQMWRKWFARDNALRDLRQYLSRVELLRSAGDWKVCISENLTDFDIKDSV